MIVGQNVAYELTGVVNGVPRPHAARVGTPRRRSRIHDIGDCARSCINLATHGKLDMVQNLDGTWSQTESTPWPRLEKAYAIDFGVNRKAEKNGRRCVEESLRAPARDAPLARWPAEAVDYAKRDAHGTLSVHDAQDDRANALKAFHRRA
jgi:hypothetical protein